MIRKSRLPSLTLVGSWSLSGTAAMAGIGIAAQPGTPQEFAAFIAAKRPQWGAAAKATGVKAN